MKMWMMFLWLTSFFALILLTACLYCRSHQCSPCRSFICFANECMNCLRVPRFGTGYRARIWMNVPSTVLPGLNAGGDFEQDVSASYLFENGLEKDFPPAAWLALERTGITASTTTST